MTLPSKALDKVNFDTSICKPQERRRKCIRRGNQRKRCEMNQPSGISTAIHGVRHALPTEAQSKERVHVFTASAARLGRLNPESLQERVMGTVQALLCLTDACLLGSQGGSSEGQCQHSPAGGWGETSSSQAPEVLLLLQGEQPKPARFPSLCRPTKGEETIRCSSLAHAAHVFSTGNTSLPFALTNSRHALQSPLLRFHHHDSEPAHQSTVWVYLPTPKARTTHPAGLGGWCSTGVPVTSLAVRV